MGLSSKHKKKHDLKAKKSTKIVDESPKLNISDDTVLALIEEKRSIDATIKTLETRKAEISNIVKQVAETRGTKNDKGSYVFTIRANDGILYGLEKNRRASVKFNSTKAIEYLKANHPKLAKVLIGHESIEVLSEDDVKNAVMANKLKVRDLDAMIDVSESFASMLYVIKEDEAELAEVEERKQNKKEKEKENPPKTSTPTKMPTIKVGGLKKRGNK